MTAAEILTPYLALFSPVHQSKPRFMALDSAVLSQAADLLSLYRSVLLETFSLDIAVGAQLDALGMLAGVPRPSPETSDTDYRLYIRAKIALHHWDGTNGSVPALLAEAFPDMNACLTDNMDGTVTASLSGSFPFPLKDVFPVPAGIRLIEEQ